MLSRVAESLYWTQRYRERAENIARLAEVNLHLNIDALGDDHVQWFPLVATTGDEEQFKNLYGDPTEANVLRFLTFDRNNPNSILNSLYKSRENARSIRTTITSEMWHELNSAYLYVQKMAAESVKKLPGREFYDQVRKSCQLFTGIMDTTMSHNEAWHFGRLGNLLERADQTSRILDTKYYMLLPAPEYVGTAYDDIQWAALLKSVSALDMYLRIHHSVHHASVAEFLILNREFPRSIHSCLYRAEDSLRRILGGDTEGFESYTRIAALCEELSRMRTYEVIKTGLHEYLDHIQARIIEINASIYTDFFALTPTASSEALEEPIHNA